MMVTLDLALKVLFLGLEEAMKRKKSIPLLLVLLSFFVGVTLILGSLGSSWAKTTEMSEIEKFIRSSVEIGEGMSEFMRQQSGKERSMELMVQWEEQINAMVAEILKAYGLTIEEYRERREQVFADEEKIQIFLDKNPDLKERYNVLPMHRGMGGGPHQ